MRILLTCAVGLWLFAAGPALAYISILPVCDEQNSEFDFEVEIFNQFIEGDVTGWEVVFEETWTGTCEPPRWVHAVPLPGFLDGATYSFSVPVRAQNEYFFYKGWLRSPTGAIQDIFFNHPAPVGVVSCGEAVAARGFLVDAGYLGFYNVTPCPEDCDTWLCSQYVDLSMLPEEDWLPFVGSDVPVDVYGDYGLVNPMLGSPCLYVTGIQATPGGCGIVAVEETTWDALKARFR